ncbi:hypothetical protein AB0D11_23140 [Streptomyces monashensis]
MTTRVALAQLTVAVAVAPNVETPEHVPALAPQQASPNTAAT